MTLKEAGLLKCQEAGLTFLINDIPDVQRLLLATDLLQVHLSTWFEELMSVTNRILLKTH